ncbi:HET-domain-containing protein [Cenococcum geophilum 1.58]|uniref:HET-domain-containing protein n=1 Tax=Cenococcum geophilum 1.58 TaxID=794803 RepID=UPI00358E360B|nr:HET-domain-containing protein [Cenococcum geophilum 1.58]
MPIRNADPFKKLEDGVSYYCEAEVPAESPKGEKMKLGYFFPGSLDVRCDDFPWLRSDYGQSNSDDPLCLLCQRLNFRYLIFNGCPYAINLGTYEEMRTRNCSFCRLILEHASRVPVLRHTAFENSDIINVTATGPDGNEEKLFSKITTWINRNHVYGDIALSIAFTYFHLGEDIVEPTFGLHSLRLEGSDNCSNMRPKTSRSLEESNALVQANYRPAIIERWLRDCINDQPVEAIDPKDIQRLIDIKRNCVVETVDIKDKLVFAALSYVWGKDHQQVTLSKGTFQSLHEPGSLSDSKITVSKTIRDAMTCCKDIEVPYLWVDALCITQDREDKMEQINNMNRIYEGAIVTIVAAHGENANAGLRGVSDSGDTPRQFRFRAQDLIIFCEGKALDKFLGDTYWSQRAWTYQEFLLAKRRLIFTENLLYFSCNHGIASEDLPLALHSSTNIGESSSLNLSGYNFNFDDILNWTAYAGLVQKFTTKKLTNQMDVIPAFTALVQFLKREIYGGTPFVCGIPIASLDAALLWRRCWGCEECDNTAAGLERRQSPEEDEPNLPSWAWAGWQGHVKYSDWLFCHKNPALSVIPRVKWLQGLFLHPQLICGAANPESPGPIDTWVIPQVKDVSRFGWKGGWLGAGDSLRSFSQPLKLLDLNRKKVSCQPHNFLLVEADVAELAVVGRLYNVNNPKEVGDYSVNGTGISIGAELGHPLTVYDPQTGIRCGVVYDDLELSTVGVSWPMLCYFVKLSQTTIGGTTDGEDPYAFLGEDWSEISPGPSKGALGRPDENNKRNADKVRNFFNYDQYDCTRKWCVYNVLMVTWKDNVAFRIGVGKVHVDAFDTSKSLKTRKIYLG